MAYMCKYSQKECDACGKCLPQAEPCPECGSLDYEEKYYIGGKWIKGKLIGGAWIGCSECVRREYVE